MSETLPNVSPSESTENVIHENEQSGTMSSTPLPRQEGEHQEASARTFTQDELNEIIKKRLARQEHSLRSEFNSRIAALNQTPQPSPALTPEQQAMEETIEQRTQQRLAQAIQQATLQQQLAEFAGREDKAREKYQNYDDITRAANVPISPTAAEVIRTLEEGPELAYYLGSNLQEAARIATLPPMRQVWELRGLAEKMKSPSFVSPGTSTKPLSRLPGSSNPMNFPTTDARSLSHMDTASWIAAESARVSKQNSR